MRALVVALVVVASACRTSGFADRPHTQVELGHATKVVLTRLKGEENGAALVRFTARGPGRLSVDAENAGELKIFGDDGTEYVASGVPPVSIARLQAGNYYVGLIGKDGAEVTVKTQFFPDDPEGLSGPDAKPDGAQELVHGVTDWGLVSAPELDRTDWVRCEVGEDEELTISARALPADGAEITLMTPGGDERAWGSDPVQTFDDPDPGSYLVQVKAKDARWAKYAVKCFGARDNPDRASGNDATIEGARELAWAHESPQDAVATARDTVDFAQGDASDWYVLRAPADGTCDISLTDGKASLSLTEVDESAAEIPKKQIGKRRCGEHPTWIRVSAEDPSQSGEYVLSVRFHTDAAASDTE